MVIALEGGKTAIHAGDDRSDYYVILLPFFFTFYVQYHGHPIHTHFTKASITKYSLMLTDKVRVEQCIDSNEPDDIFSSAVGLIFTDDLRNQHGDPGATVIYKSNRYGDIKLSVADPVGEDDRRLFAHYLWNAGVYLAELISEEEGWSVKDETVIELGAGAVAIIKLR